MVLGDAPKLRAIVRMAGGDDTGDAALGSAMSSSEDFATVLTDENDHRIVGQRLLIQRGTKRRIATGGPIVWVGGKPYQLTVGHVLEDEDELPTVVSDETVNFDGCSFDGDSGPEEDFEPSSDQDVPSGGSRTPEDLLSADSDDEDAPGSGDSSCLAGQKATLSSDREDLVRRFDFSIDLGRDDIGDQKGPTNDDTVPDGFTSSASRHLGKIFLSSGDSTHPDLDYALVEVDWSRSGDVVKVREYLDNCVKMSLAPDRRVDEVAVSVWTHSQGIVHGKLSATASYMRVPGGRDSRRFSYFVWMRNSIAEIAVQQ
jgi:hypothetical protein